jgi:hypothetical protein
MRPQPLPAQLRIQAHESPGGLVHVSGTLVHTVLPGFFQLQQQVINILLPGLNQPVWLTQDTAGHEVHQGCMGMPERMLGDRLHASQQRLQGLTQLLFTFDHEFGCYRGGGGTQIGHKIGNRVINFMPHGRNDRDLRSGNGAHDLFFIEGPEVFE